MAARAAARPFASPILDRVAQIAERQRTYPLPSGSENGVAERGRERRKCGFAHAGGWKIRLDEIRLNQHGCEGHAQGRIVVVVLLLDTALLEVDLQPHRGGKGVG